ncbi:hypothetical protein PSQ90_13945 [Devosia rhodophyticola]|uniref:Uncharacterized protein n=1 Tax=Devosia rhodophyticola TaxID=3026423 RepID=A0ABY7YVI7_9HYPH|nr:hypothetical protein [Devosia rhodophyticola]WDR05373.1 hypothetical protein PSQ90_13945 [Devosia rhodophyticola]
MDTKAAVLALMSVWGVGICAPVPAVARDSGEKMDIADDAATDNLLLNRVWVRTDTDDGQPGTMQIFLADGTLVSDSCWETYRLSIWQQVSKTAISWDEDGVTINADIAALSSSELVLKLDLGREVQEQHFTAASTPYLCPDVPK